MNRIGSAKRIEETIQNMHDRFYHEHGNCCAGCDHWRWHNSLVGDCTRTAPVSAKERFSMVLDAQSLSIEPEAGHIITGRDHVCGEFVDTYDWDRGPNA